MRRRKSKSRRRKRRKIGRRLGYRTGSRHWTITRRCDGSTIPGLAVRAFSQVAGIGNIAMTFTLGDLPNSSEFTNLFQYFKLKKVVVWVTPIATVTALTAYGGAPPTYGMFGALVLKENAVFTTLAQYEQYPAFRYRSVVGLKPMKIVIKNPPFVEQAGASAATPSYRTGWLPCNGTSASLVHYGLYLYIDPYNSVGTAQTFQVTARYTLALKGLG